MPRTTIPVSSLTQNAQNTTPAGTAVDPTNGMAIAAPPARTHTLLIRVTNTAGATKVLTFKAGAINPPAVRKGLGDLTVTLPATVGDNTFLLETARFAQADGTINVDLAAAATGIISAIAIPRGV